MATTLNITISDAQMTRLGTLFADGEGVKATASDIEAWLSRQLGKHVIVTEQRIQTATDDTTHAETLSTLNSTLTTEGWAT